MELQRKIYNKLVEWKNKSNGTTALLIEGARRIGKSYIAELFGKREYKSYLVIDFSNIEDTVLDIFKNDKTNLDMFFQKLSIFYSVKFYNRETLIIFDEIQLFPQARQLIKHLVKDGRYDYIETGSLLSLKQNVSNIVIPSEEEKIDMHPLDFEEFLWALEDEFTIPYIKECFENKKSVGAQLHRKIMNLFRQYILVGGMPQAVLKYIETRDFEEVDNIKRRIINLYRNDVSKFASGYENKVKSIFDEIPSQLSKHEKKFKLSSISKEARFREYEDSFMWLDEAKIVNVCFNCQDPNVGLKINSERMTLKLYMADTGLLVTHCFDENDFSKNVLYKSILLDKIEVNEGMIMENIVAQILTFNNKKLYFYSRKDNNESKNTMEIDFLISDNKKVIPIEIKSGKNITHTSLDKFKNKFSKKIGTRYVVWSKDLKIEGDIIFIPIYMTMFL